MKRFKNSSLAFKALILIAILGLLAFISSKFSVKKKSPVRDVEGVIAGSHSSGPANAILTGPSPENG